MKRIAVQRVVLALALLTVLTVLMWATPVTARLEPVGEGELRAAVGGACRGLKEDANFCNVERVCAVVVPNLLYKKIDPTYKVKRWCDRTSPGRKTCDCNQDGINPDVCVYEWVCYDVDCEDCRPTPSPVTFVQSAVNLYGEPCANDAECDS